MNDLETTTCQCLDCPGDTCTCGCQSAIACHCGPACACGTECQCGADCACHSAGEA